MTKLFSIVALLATALTVSAQERFELGIGAGTSHPFAASAFKDSSTSGDVQQYWLGYGFDKNWGVELGLDNFDFDKSDMKSQFIDLAATYRFVPQSWVHPIAKLGLGSMTTKNIADDKNSGIGAKFALGLEADFKYISIGALANYIYADKVVILDNNAEKIKHAQAILPTAFLTVHNALEEDKKSEPVAQVAPAPVAPVVVKKDSDGDGVSDEDDKCPNTPAGVVVNEIGCSEKEKASVKLQVEFLKGKADLDNKFEGDVENLANFMKKFPNTKVDIEGHTDTTGSLKLNNTLSQKRAESVKAALVAKGIDASRITAKGYGPSRPIASNKTKEGRAANRRVMAEIAIVTDKKK